MNRDEVYNKVKAVLVDALGVDEEEVKPTATLRGDLGAESIDFLDIVFRLEKAFTTDPAKPFKIPRGDMFPEDVFNNPQFVDGGKVTAAGLDELKKRMPHADLSMLKPGDDIEKMEFTVDTIVNYMESKVNSM
ncbi:MAG TPA: acyl carrier protein [Tepidisphaeraceae bacterium]|nr:acyl carrier protein [Tepidisphaeraceae bacterium]